MLPKFGYNPVLVCISVLIVAFNHITDTKHITYVQIASRSVGTNYPVLFCSPMSHNLIRGLVVPCGVSSIGHYQLV